MRVAVLAPGESMTEQLAQACAISFDAVVCVSNTYQLLKPEQVYAVVASDAAWWDYYNPQLPDTVRRLCACDPRTLRVARGVSKVPGYMSDTSSGVLGIAVARDYLDATEIVLFGYDHHGSHFFGDHPEPLKNTDEKRFRQFTAQFRSERQRCQGKCVVYNATNGSALDVFPRVDCDYSL